MDKQREEFEKWWQAENYDQQLSNIQGVMFNRIKNGMFAAWQAASNSPEIPDGWTHFAERLPDVGTTNIIYGNLPASSTKYAVCEYGKYGFDRSCVTHWMPLPAPPKKEK